MKIKRGTLIRIKPGITEEISAYGAYQSGDVGTVIAIEGNDLIVTFRTPDEDGDARTGHTVRLDECQPATKLNKILS